MEIIVNYLHCHCLILYNFLLPFVYIQRAYFQHYQPHKQHPINYPPAYPFP
ncbi:hypothetical protein G4228_004472 [Cervus hanglu yarkandensis]|nr:hypothetical protein G4228_004472 [Cervus hanglu yarkandensis]